MRATVSKVINRLLILPLIPLLTPYTSAAADTYSCNESLGKHLATAEQLIVVTSADWNEGTATIQRFERDSKSESWSSVGQPSTAVLGKSGMAWGLKFRSHSLRTDPIKKEGDGRSPAGVFLMGSAFGFAKESPVTKTYRHLSPTTHCVDDVESRYYNQIVDTSDPTVKIDWNSSEKMRDISLYKHGIEILYESDSKARGGSCLFFHIWRSANKGTAGCTAVAESDLEEMIKWMNADKQPAVVQLPRDVYRKMESCWKLPPLPNSAGSAPRLHDSRKSHRNTR